MNATYFRALILLSLLASFAANLVDNLFPSLLAGFPTDAFAHAEQPFESWILGNYKMSLAIGVAYILCMLVSIIGLFLFRGWGRTLAVVVSVINIGSMPFIGPNWFSGLAYALFELSAMSWGAVLALAYFSPISQRFVAHTTPPVNS